jgi:hypothetical protein
MGDDGAVDDAFIAVVVLVSVAALVVAIVVLATSGGAYDEIGRGGLADEAPAPRETYADVVAEVRAHVEVRNERRVARGEAPLDVEAEVARRLRES